MRVVALLHREERRPELFVVQSAQVLQLGGELGKVLVLERVLGSDPLVGVVGEEAGEYILDVVGAACGEELLKADSLLGWEIDLHVGGLGFEPVEDFLLGGAEDVVDPMDLVEFVLAREEGLFGDEFEEDAAEAPDVHFFVVVAVSHEALGGAVPAGGDVVGVGGGGVFALAGAEVCEFDEVALDEDVFGLDVAVEDALAVHELDGPQHLEHVELYLLEGQRALLALQALVQIHVHQLEHQRQLP